jgi:hypothetical protein
MCKFASFVLTKDREFYIDGEDSHSSIIQKFDLHEHGARGANIVKVEITPIDRIKKWPNLKAWKFVVDQDILPDWHDAATTERRTRVALLRRYKEGFKTVYASGCTALTELRADAAETVDASGCTALTELRADAAEYVYASGCTALTELRADAAEYVYASGCNMKIVIKVKKGCRIIR